MSRHRVLIVDDSPFVRRLLKDWLSSEADFEVVGAAQDGVEGVAMAKSLKPDLITLDVEMPRMDGLAALGQIMQEAPCAVLMVSSVTKQGAWQTMQALEQGAIDFVTKPDGPSSIRLVHAKDELLLKARTAMMARRPRPLVHRPAPAAPQPIRAKFEPPKAAGLPPSAQPSRPAAAAEPARPAASAAAEPARVAPAKVSLLSGGNSDRVVLVASSTGGPRALTTLFESLPKGFPAPMVVVQHMPAGFTESLAKRLDLIGAIAVKEAKPGDRVMPGLALVAPGGIHMEIGRGGIVEFHEQPPLHGVRPAADYMLKSASAIYGSRCLAVILTGMGRDGASGALDVRKAGGLVLGESESSAVIYGMPRVAKEIGATHEEFPIDQMGSAICAAIAKKVSHAA